MPLQTYPDFPVRPFTVVITYYMISKKFTKTKEVIVDATERGNAKYEAREIYGKKYPNIINYEVMTE